MQCRGQRARFAGPQAGGLLAAVAAALLAPGGVEAGDKVYTVANYPVEAVAENAVAAKKKALAEGQQAAFRSLLKRLMPVMAYPRAKHFASIRAVELIEGIKVRSERNSATEYSASYDFYFRPKSIRDLLRREGIPFTDEQAPVVTLIPLWQAAAKSSLGDQTAWTNSWKGLDLENALTPVRIEAIRKEVEADAVAAAVGGDEGAMRTLAGQHKTERALLAVAEPDAASGRLVVTLAGRDAVGAFVLTRQYRIELRRSGVCERACRHRRPADAGGTLEVGPYESRRGRRRARGYRAADCGRVSRHGRMAGHQPQAQRYAGCGRARRGGALRAGRARDAALCRGSPASRAGARTARPQSSQRRRELAPVSAVGPNRELCAPRGCRSQACPKHQPQAADLP